MKSDDHRTVTSMWQRALLLYFKIMGQSVISGTGHESDRSQALLNGCSHSAGLIAVSFTVYQRSPDIAIEVSRIF